MESALAGASRAAAFAPPPLSGKAPLSIDEVVLRHLRTAREVEQVTHLRGEIDLSVHAAAGPQFDTLEKKETSWASCADSSSAVNGSAPSASCRSAIN